MVCCLAHRNLPFPSPPKSNHVFPSHSFVSTSTHILSYTVHTTIFTHNRQKNLTFYLTPTFTQCSTVCFPLYAYVNIHSVHSM